MSTIWAFDHVKKQAYFISWGRLYKKFLLIFKRTGEKNS